ncbi:MAG: hypothetical protein U1F67_21345 [Rubrivivax sp.]
MPRRPRPAGNIPCTGDDGCSPLDAAAWWRLAALRSFATPLPQADAARLPLAVLPPNRVRVLNAAQALQVLLTLLMTASDWCARIGEVAALLPAHNQRIDLWVGAIASPAGRAVRGPRREPRPRGRLARHGARAAALATPWR